MNFEQMTDFCIKACKRLGQPNPNLQVIISRNSRIASYLPKSDTILVDPNVENFLSDRDAKTILLHEVCHVVEILQAREDGRVAEPDYEEEFRKTKGHNQAFRDLAERARRELNDGVNVFKIPELFCDAKPDDRIRLLCDAMGFDIKNVVGCIGYFDTSMNDDEKVLVRPDTLEGERLCEDELCDIADSIACAQGANSDEEFDRAVETANKIWADWAREGE